MNFIIYSIGFLLEHLKYIILYKNILKIPLKNTKWAYIMFPLCSVMMSVVYFELAYGEKCIVYLILLLLQSYIFLKEKASRVLVLTLWSFCTLNCITAIVEQWVVVFPERLSLKGYSESIADLSSQLFILIFLLIIKQTLDKRFNYKKMTVRYYVLFLIILAFNSFALAMLEGIVENETDLVKVAILEIVYVAIIVFVYVQLVLIMYLSVTRDAYKEKDELNKRYLKAEEEQYLYLEQREQETKKFRHDIRNHIDVLLELCREGNIEQLQTYLQAMSGRVAEYSKRVSVNYNIADAIINQYIDICEKENIELKVSGHFPSECLVEPFDICTVISNMLKNARTATLKCQKRWIKYIIKYNEESKEILIRMQNTYDSVVDFQSTTKEDKSSHGYGLINIKEAAERYHGIFEIREKNGVVETNVTLLNQPLEQKTSHWSKKY